MDLEMFDWLRSPQAEALLAELAARPLREGDMLREMEWLRRHVPLEQARAILELARLRRRAVAKFPAAERLYFTRDALEQASAAPVAAHRAARLARCGHIADLGCGIGGDTLALAAAGARVTAVERDPLRLAMARANAEALGLGERIDWRLSDLGAEDPPLADALFSDPGRRAGGRRRFDVESYDPPLSRVLAWQDHNPALVVKVAPGIDLAALPADVEVEFVSLDGELKEAVIWCGPLARAARRASVLRAGANGEVATHTLWTGHGTARLTAPLVEPDAFLYEPDPAVIRAGLVADLALQIGAAQLDPTIAYLTAPTCIATPFARAWPVLEWFPFSLKRLRARLRELRAGPVTVKKRGSPLNSDALSRQLSGAGARPLVVALTQVRGRPAALICDAPIPLR
ncbi:MAG: class I SAM-dependent methyltransferase [Oscillochloridaceae bacterium]|nr:methyltransferase domain-containing protein [Chloroflexaceae bacterium]MDW8391721.1 class I SAM-dependent methyltransferase [Oscillochloridaceae bacterium]